MSDIRTEVPSGLVVTLEIEAPQSRWPASPWAFVRVTNHRGSPVEIRNEDRGRGVAVLRAIGAVSREPAGEPLPPQPVGTTAPTLLEPGQTIEERFLVADRWRFPGAGGFDLRAEVSWGAGRATSEPVRIELLPARPAALSLATVTGGLEGHVYCAWVHRGEGRAEIWLSLLSASGRPGFLSTVRLAEVAGVGAGPGAGEGGGEASRSITPVLSAPADRAPWAQWVAWIEDATLGYARHQSGAVNTGALPLGSKGISIAGPVLEMPAAGGNAPHAEAILIAPSPRGWSLRTARLGPEPALGDALEIDLPLAVWAAAACRPDATRCGVFLVPWSLRGDVPMLMALVAGWPRTGGFEPPVRVADWTGALVCADQRLIAGGIVSGAALLDQAPAEPRYVLQPWRLLPRDRFEDRPAVALSWEPKGPIDQAILRLDRFGRVHGLLHTGGAWHGCEDDGRVRALPEPIASAGAPIDLYFRDGVEPVCVLADPGSGLRLTAAR